jgi:ABC-type transport system involved in multi-copper enzyme maturation permease subunit
VWSELLTDCGFFSLAISVLAVAFLGGNAIAGERADRSAEFFAYLPVQRAQSMASRLIVVVGAGLLVWLINLVVVYWVAPHVGYVSPTLAQQLAALRHQTMPGITLTAALAFGTAWLCSSLLSSPSIATALGLVSPALLFMVLAIIWDIVRGSTPWYEAEFIAFWYAILAPALACLCLVTGCVHYLRRVEP